MDPTKKLTLYPKATPAKAAAIPASGFLPLNKKSKAPSGINTAYPTSFTILENIATKNSIKVNTLGFTLASFLFKSV